MWLSYTLMRITECSLKVYRTLYGKLYINTNLIGPHTLLKTLYPLINVQPNTTETMQDNTYRYLRISMKYKVRISQRSLITAQKMKFSI